MADHMITTRVPVTGLALALARVASYEWDALALTVSNQLCRLEAEPYEPAAMKAVFPWWNFTPREQLPVRFVSLTLAEDERRSLSDTCHSVSVATHDPVLSRQASLARDWLRADYQIEGAEPVFVLKR